MILSETMFGKIKGGFLNKKKKTKKSGRRKATKEGSSQASADAKNKSSSTGPAAQATSQECATTVGSSNTDVEHVHQLNWILDMVRGRRNQLQGSYLGEMMNQRTFRKQMYPLETRDEIKRTGLPGNLDAFIDRCASSAQTSSPAGLSMDFRAAALDLMPNIITKTDSILDGVARKSKVAGEKFDDEVANALRPQILLEAFARKMPEIVQRAAARAQRSRVQIGDRVAPSDPNFVLCRQQQLDDVAIKTLFPRLCGTTTSSAAPHGSYVHVAHNFLGKPWVKCVSTDCARYALFEKDKLKRIPTPSTLKQSKQTGPLISVLAPPELLEKEYPALCEVIDCVRLLPFEINCRTNGASQLCVPSAARSLLAVFDGPEAFHERMTQDNSPNDGEDNGTSLTALYYSSVIEIPPQTTSLLDEAVPTTNWHNTPTLIIEREDGSQVDIPVQPDQLVIFDSRRVKYSHRYSSLKLGAPQLCIVKQSFSGARL